MTFVRQQQLAAANQLNDLTTQKEELMKQLEDIKNELSSFTTTK
jgi:hypothetical protein